MIQKSHLLFLVTFLLSLHHQVQTQKPNFCNVTEPYFVEVTKTETVLGFKPKPSGFNLLGMLSGNKYENVTKTFIGVEKRERIVEECCKGYKKRDNQCIPMDETKLPKEPSSTTTTSTTTTTAAPSSTSTTTAAPIPSEPPAAPPSSSTEPETQPSTSETIPSEVVPPAESSAAPVAAAAPEPTIQTNALLESTSAPEVSPSAPSESPITNSSLSPAPELSAEAALAVEVAPLVSSESPIITSPSAPEPESSSASEVPPPTSSESPSSVAEPAPSPEPSSSAPSESSAIVSSPEVPPQTTVQLIQAETIVNDNRRQGESMLLSLVTMSGSLAEDRPTTMPHVSSYSNSEIKLINSDEPATTKPSEKLVDDATVLYIDLTTITNSRSRRSLDQSSDDSVESIEVFEFESNTLPDDLDELSESRKNNFRLSEKSASLKNSRHSSVNDNIVVSDLTVDNEDQGYSWVEILEVLSVGAIVFLLVVTVQMSFNVEPFSRSNGNKKIPQEIDSYGEYWVCNSQSSLEEV